MADELTYLYAVTDADLPDAEVSDLRAVDGAPVHVITEASLAAVVSPVAEERFNASALRRSLEDLQWLETVARAHDMVVSTLVHRRPVAPVRLATVFVDEDNVRALLRDRAEQFGAALDRVRGRVEWAVKTFVSDGGDAEQAPAASAPGTGPGRAYLQRKRAQREGAARHREQALAAAEALHERLARVAVASRRYRPQDRRLTGHRDEMLLNVAYLLNEGGEAELRRVAAENRATDLRTELTGPWAPYSFSGLEEP